MKLEHSRFITALILILFSLTIVVYAVLIVCRPDYGLYGVYYDNQEWKEKPYFTSIDTDISSNTLREQRKKLSQNIYSVEWTGYVDIPETGIYTFATSSDDGSWLFIDDILVVDNGGAHGLLEKEGQIHLIKGLHSIKIRYFQIGGYAVLNVLWAKDAGRKTPLTAEFLLPPKAGLANFWIYQTGKLVFPYLIALCGLLIVSIGVSISISLRKTRVRTIITQIFYRLFIEPLSFFAHQLRKPQFWYWTIVVIYTAIIFLTLSYARDVSNYLTNRYGDDVFSQITVFTLSVSGIGFFLYLIISRTHLVSRMLYFVGIVAVYGYILSPEFRETIHSLTQVIGYTGKFLDSLNIYPIVPAEKVHFLEYGLLGLLLCKTLSYHIKDKTAYLLAVVIVYIIGMMDEGIQWALPNRVGEYRDIWLNFISGGLAVLMVWLVIRPFVFRKRFQWSSLRPLFYTLSVALIFSGLFLQVVHGFGSSIFMPDSGTQFVSAFSEQQLLKLDKTRIQRMQGELVEDIPANDLRIFRYEAWRHHYLRNLHYNNKRFFASYCEQEILKTYFRSFVRKLPLQLFEYEPEQFAISPDPNAHVFYFSPGQELSITSFSKRAMWIVISIAVFILCLTATCLPVSADRIARYKNRPVPKDPQKRFERIILRPLFGLVFVIGGIIAIYPAGTPKKLNHTNLLILTLESSQPDYLSAYGYHNKTTPFFDELASEGVLFSNMIAAASWTIPSLTSMLTGVSPNVHGIDARGKLMDQQIPTLFEALEQHGYVIGDTSYTLTEPSINSVFKKTDIAPEAALAEGRSEESYLLSWMEANKDKPFFGWVHFHTTHLPYRATPPYNKLFLDDIDQGVLTDEQIKVVLSQIIIRKGEVEFDKERHTEVVRALFTQTLRQQDAKVGKVLMKLDELGLRDNTIIIITADHGDELLEHGFIGHASTSWDTTVYDDLINIPLLIYYPKKLPQGKRIDAQVRMIDIMPTVLNILEIPFSEQIQGKSFLPLIQGEAGFQETAFSETTPCGYSCPTWLVENRIYAVRTNEWKLISTYNNDTKETGYELYNLKDDPAETTNVIDQYPDITAQFKQELQRWMEAPKQFTYQTKKIEHEHYLDVDVEVRPIILFPKVGTVLSSRDYNQRVLMKWIGKEDLEYIIEYEVGSGGYYMTGELEVVGPEQWFGPFPEDIWQALPLYNPWKFRVFPKQYPQYPSEWITFEMKYK